LYIAVPLSWLTGYAVGGLVGFAGANGTRKLFRPPFTQLSSYLIASALVSAVITGGGSRLVSEVADVRDLPRIHDSAVISKMKEFASKTKWVYCDGAIYPFHAALPVIPELAVLASKRFWSGQIDTKRINAIVVKYKPEQILLCNGDPNDALKRFIDSAYAQVYRDDSSCLYVKRFLISK
jgi:hypothetical protein